MSAQDHESTIRRVDHALSILRHVVDLAMAKVSTGNAPERSLAVAEIVPGAANIALAMRALLDKRLLSPTEVLLRAFLDRVGTIAYLRVKGAEGLSLWRSGWPKNRRPSFAQKLEMLPDEIYAHPDSVDPNQRYAAGHLKIKITALKQSMHSAVHGGPESIVNTVVRQDGKFDVHIIGPDYENNNYFSNLSHLVVISIMLFVFELEDACDTRGQQVMA